MTAPYLNIKKYLANFVQIPDEGFSGIFDRLQDKHKNKSRQLLVYLDKLINRTINLKKGELTYSHIHFDGIDDNIKNIIAEFIVLKFFFLGIDSDTSTSEYINAQISKVNRVLKEPIHLPLGVKGGSKQQREIKDNLTKQKNRKAFFEDLSSIKGAAGLRPTTLINILSKQEKIFEKLFEVRPFCIPTTALKKDRSYVLTNTDLTRDKIDSISDHNENALLDIIENIIIFDCEGKQIHRQWNFKELKEWKETYRNSFNNLFIFSFNDTGYSFNGLKTQIERIQSRFFSIPEFPQYACYLISHNEIGHLLNEDHSRSGSIEFIGEPICSFWEDFKTSLQLYEGLYELRSYKMMNIYSLAINESLQEMIIVDLFDANILSSFIAKETKDILNELASETIEDLRSSLRNVFKWFEEIKWTPSFIKDHLVDGFIIFPGSIRKHPKFMIELLRVLGLANEKSILGWQDIAKYNFKKIIALEYRDFGPFPYGIVPNVFRPGLPNSLFKGFFIASFFEKRGLWSIYNYLKDMARLLDHPIREREMNWNGVLNDAIKDKPKIEDHIDWSEEKNYQSTHDLTTVKIRFKDGSRRTFPSSELFIYRSEVEPGLRVERIENLSSAYSAQILYIQRLEDLYSDFNIYEKIANKEREEAELRVIRKNYGLEVNEPTRRLWKVLLKRKANEIGTNELFEEIKNLLNKNKLGIVSIKTFEDSWLDPDNDTLLPRGTRIFLCISEYLKLPKSYFRIMLRLKNVEIQSTRSSSKQMNELLSDLINDGCFDKEDFIRIIFEQSTKYIRKHNFDEIGIPSDQVAPELGALVQLLKPYLRLLQVDKIEINQL